MIPIETGGAKFSKAAQIILLSILSACLYGVVHDQITIRVCLEYFTVAHPPYFPTHSPTLLAICWGVAATAGIGAVLVDDPMRCVIRGAAEILERKDQGPQSGPGLRQ